MGHDQYGHPSPVQFEQTFAQCSSRYRVEGAQRLVQDQHPRFQCQQGGDPQLHLFAVRELEGRAFTVAVEVQPDGGAGRPRAPLALSGGETLFA